MTTILYNGINPFSGIAPTPLLSRTVSMLRFGDRWGQRHDITLRGQITGQCLAYSGFVARQQLLLTGFNKDFQSLEIYDGASLVTGYDFVRVAAIEFDDSTYANGLLPFTVNLEAYPEEYFSGAYGVINPSEQVTFEEEDDGRIRITHSTSAQGFCTASTNPSNALTNAREWVQARTGWSSQILPAFISGVNNGVCLQEIAENYDRLNARYEVVETYIGDQFNDVTQGVLRYTTDFNSGIEEGIATIELQGELKGCRYQDIDLLRDRYQGFDAFSEALNQFRRITSRTDLNSTPVSKGVSEDTTNKAISFNYVFNDDMRPRVNVVYSIEFSYNFEEDVISASISATVSSKSSFSTNKWNEVKSLADSIDLYSLVVPAYNTYVSQVAPHLSNAPLNRTPLSTSRSDNEFACIASLSATFSNAPAPPQGLDSFNSTIAFTPAIHKYAASPILDGLGEYYIFDLGFVSRGSIDISVQGIGSDTTTPSQTLSILKTQVQNLNADYFGGARMVIDSQSYVTGNASFGKSASVSATFSAESTEFTL